MVYSSSVGILGGVSNTVTGGSFLNGFCGGFVNGSINMAGSILLKPFFGNLLGGAMGNLITENFNNMDISEQSLQKSQSNIVYNSIISGALQALLGIIPPIKALSEGAGLKGSISYYIAKFFGNDLEFVAGNIGSIAFDGIYQNLWNRNLLTSSEGKE